MINIKSRYPLNDDMPKDAITSSSLCILLFYFSSPKQIFFTEAESGFLIMPTILPVITAARTVPIPILEAESTKGTI